MQFKMRPRYTSEKYASTDADDGRIVFSDIKLVGFQCERSSAGPCCGPLFPAHIMEFNVKSKRPRGGLSVGGLSAVLSYVAHRY